MSATMLIMLRIFLLFILILEVSFDVIAQNSSNVENMNRLALRYLDEGRYKEAEPLLKKIVEIDERLFGRNNKIVAIDLNNLGKLYRLLGQYSEAEQLYKRALEIRVKEFGTENTDVARTMYNLGVVYDYMGSYEEAVTLFNKALKIYEKSIGDHREDVARVNNNIGNVYFNEGRFLDAEPYFKNAIIIGEKLSSSKNSELTTSISNLATLYNQLGRYNDAESMFKRAMILTEQTKGKSHPDYAIVLDNLALLYESIGHEASAERLFNQAIEIQEKKLGLSHPTLSKTMTHLASLYLTQGKYNQAEKLLKNTIGNLEGTLGSDHPYLSEPFNNLAMVYEYQKSFDEAEKFLIKSTDIAQKFGNNSYDMVAPLNNLGVLYHDQGKFNDAELKYRQALTITENNLGPNHPEVARTLLNLAKVCDSLQRYQEAEILFMRALDIMKSVLGENNPQVIEILNSMADHYNQQGNYPKALSIIDELLSTNSASRDIALKVLSNAQRLNIRDSQNILSASYKALQITSSNAAAEAIAKLGKRIASSNKELEQKIRFEQDLSNEESVLNNALFASIAMPPKQRSIEYEHKLRSRLKEVLNKKNLAIQTLRESYPSYSSLTMLSILSIEETQKFLDENEAIVAISTNNDLCYVWVVTSKDAFWTNVPCIKINSQVNELRESLSFFRNGKQNNLPFNSVLAHKIYVETIGPIADKIKNKKRISIIANEALTSIPFGLLVTKEPKGESLKDTGWLIKSYAITVLPSIYSLKAMRAQAGVSSAAKPMIAFADPVFSKAAQAQANQQVAMRSMTSFYNGTQIDIPSLGEHLPQLPNTRDEVQTISRELGAGSDDIKLGLQATETAVKQAKLDQYRVVYFATHGLVAGDLEKFSKAKAEPALALTIPSHPTDQDDGLLQASEIAQLKLNADWAVLSACNTASSDGVGAEALSGLARAFIYAGARSLLVSNWDVSDDATKSLMTSLFEISSKNKSLSHGEALQQATLQLLNNAKTEEEAHPRYWAPFIVVGEPDNKMSSRIKTHNPDQG